MKFYAICCVLGTVLPLSQLLLWLQQNPLDIVLMVQMVSNDRLSSFAWLDVIVSAVVLITYIVWESRRLRIANSWVPIMATCSVGVSLGLPLFLLMKQRQLKLAADNNAGTSGGTAA